MFDPAQLRVRWLTGRYAVGRLDARTPLPAWLLDGAGGDGLLAIVRTPGEVSIVLDSHRIPIPRPAELRLEDGWSGLAVDGPLDFALVGVMARLTAPLAQAGISVFAISTYDTDYLLVKSAQRAAATAALRTVAEVVD